MMDSEKKRTEMPTFTQKAFETKLGAW